MKRRIFTVAVFLLSTVGGFAQMRLTVDDAVKLALDENPTIKVAEMEVERYDYVTKSMRGNLYPHLSVEATYNYAAKAQQMSKSMQLAADGANSINAGATLSVPLYAPAVYRTLKLNKTQMTAAVESARASKLDMVAEVKKAFYGTLLAVQSLEVLEESAKISKKTVDDTQVMFDNGLAAEYDLLTAQVQYSNLQPTIIETRNSINISKLVLKMFLSIPENVEIEVVGTLDELKGEVVSGNNALSTDVSNNSDLKLLDIQSTMLQQQLRVSNAAKLPTLAAYGTFTYYGAESANIAMGVGGMTAAGTVYYGQFPINLGIKLSVPIFTGLTNINNANSIKNQISQLELQRTYAEEGIKTEVQSSINSLIAAREKLVANELTAKQARKAHSISNTRYEAGAGTILEVNSALLAQIQSELNYSQAIYEYLSAKCEYNKVTGKDF